MLQYLLSIGIYVREEMYTSNLSQLCSYRKKNEDTVKNEAPSMSRTNTNTSATSENIDYPYNTSEETAYLSLLYDESGLERLEKAGNKVALWQNETYVVRVL